MYICIMRWGKNLGWKIKYFLQRKLIAFSLSASAWMGNQYRHSYWKMLTRIQKTGVKRKTGRCNSQVCVPHHALWAGWVGSPGDENTESWGRNGVNLSVASTLPAWPCVHFQLFCRQWTWSFCTSLTFCSLAPTILCRLLAISVFPARQFSCLFTQVWQTSLASLCKG